MTVTSGERSLTSGQVKDLLYHITHLRDESLLRLAISGGLRRDDIIQVLRRNVDFKKGSVMFYEHKKKRFWTVFLPETVMNTLHKYINVTKSSWLFPAHNPKKHIASKTAYNILQRNLEKAGLHSIPFHALRSTCVKLCQRSGWTPEQTAKHIGDAVRTVQEHYSTPTVEEMKETARGKPIL